MPRVIVSYDGTRNDRDALALGRLFAHAGADVALAYVRHAVVPDAEAEAAAQAEAEHLLEVGAGLVEGTNVVRHVILNASTADGLAALAGELDADVIAFGSSYRTPSGRVEVPQTAEQLLDRGVSCSLALAPAGLRREPVEHSIGTVSVHDANGDAAPEATALSLAHALGAVVTADEADLLVVGSRQEAKAGQLLLSGRGRDEVDKASYPVLLLARGAELAFA